MTPTDQQKEAYLKLPPEVREANKRRADQMIKDLQASRSAQVIPNFTQADDDRARALGIPLPPSKTTASTSSRSGWMNKPGGDILWGDMAISKSHPKWKEYANRIAAGEKPPGGLPLPNKDTPSSQINTTKPTIPSIWGDPPSRQTRDRVQLPDGTMGSSTMRKWMEENIKKHGTPKEWSGTTLNNTPSAEQSLGSSGGLFDSSPKPPPANPAQSFLMAEQDKLKPSTSAAPQTKNTSKQVGGGGGNVKQPPRAPMRENQGPIVAGDGQWKPGPQEYNQIKKLAQLGDSTAIRQLTQATPPDRDIYGNKIQEPKGPDEIQREVNARQQASDAAYSKAIESRQKQQDDWQRSKDEARAKSFSELKGYQNPRSIFGPGTPQEQLARTGASNWKEASAKMAAKPTPQAPSSNSKSATAADMPIEGVRSYRDGGRITNLRDLISKAQSGEAAALNYISNKLTDQEKQFVPKNLLDGTAKIPGYSNSASVANAAKDTSWINTAKMSSEQKAAALKQGISKDGINHWDQKTGTWNKIQTNTGKKPKSKAPIASPLDKLENLTQARDIQGNQIDTADMLTSGGVKLQKNQRADTRRSGSGPAGGLQFRNINGQTRIVGNSSSASSNSPQIPNGPKGSKYKQALQEMENRGMTTGTGMR